jgi:putative peptidoglycan lipid II flippase
VNRLLQLAIAGLVGLALFSLGTLMLRIPEATLLMDRLQGRFRRR